MGKDVTWLAAGGGAMAAAVAATLSALELAPEDAAAAKLALTIAENIDSTLDGVAASRYLGPELLKVLAELGATPAARARIKNAAKAGENAPAAPVNWLDQQRQSRATRSAKRT